MIYIFQRTIQNDFNWTKPSTGRLGKNGEGEYVQKNGFGHEDWNFNKNFLINGFMYGYCYYRPSEIKRNEHFNIVFATYSNKKWYLIGFYFDCEFVSKPPVKNGIIRQKTHDLQELGDSLGEDWRNRTNKNFMEQLRDEAQGLKWRVSPENAIILPQPIEIIKNVFDTKNYRIDTPTGITEETFNSLCSLTSLTQENEEQEEREFPEGKPLERNHKSRERNQAVIKAAKNSFKEREGRLYCQVCGFDFYNKYGDIGYDFIEGHHNIPISKLKGDIITKVKDIALVCSNCHRMLHRGRHWLTIKELKGLINENP